MTYINNVLVTGCRGQLGRSLADIAKDYSDFTFFFTDREELDITDAEAVEAYVLEHEIDVVINCAAYTAVDKAESEPELCELINHYAAGYLAEAVQLREGIMVQISTDYVFDGNSNIPYTEDMPTNPLSVYGRTKLAGEKAVQAACENSLIIRTSWLYSPYGNNFVKTMWRKGRRNQKNIGVIYDQIGSPTYAGDLAEAILDILYQEVIPGIYNYSNEGTASWYDLTMAIFRNLSSESYDYTRPLLTSQYPTAAPRPHYSVLDKTKIKKTYGLKINYWDDPLFDHLGFFEYHEEEETKKGKEKK